MVVQIVRSPAKYSAVEEMYDVIMHQREDWGFSTSAT
jgi:hypothetical protein